MFNFFDRFTNINAKETAYLESEQTRKLKILLAFCLIFMILAILALISDGLNLLLGTNGDVYSAPPVLFFFIATIISYRLGRAGNYSPASLLLVISCTVTLLVIFYTYGSDLPLLIFLLLPIIMAIILLDTFAIVFVTVLCIAATLGLFTVQDLLGIYKPIAGAKVPKAGIIIAELFIVLFLFPALIALILIPTRLQARVLRVQNQRLLEALRQVETRQQTNQAVSQQVRVLAAELMDSAAQQAGGSQQQAAVVTQVDVSLNELSVAASNIAQMAVQANRALDDVAQDSRNIEETTQLSVQQSEEGLVAVQQTMTVSREVAGLYQEFLQMTTTLKERNANMRQILQIISSIAAETHLLSLNAAIEAAGAGQNTANGLTWWPRKSRIWPPEQVRPAARWFRLSSKSRKPASLPPCSPTVAIARLRKCKE